MTSDLNKQAIVDALMTARCYITDAIYTEQQQMAGYEHLSDLSQMRKDLLEIDSALDLLGGFDRDIRS